MSSSRSLTRSCSVLQRSIRAFSAFGLAVAVAGSSANGADLSSGMLGVIPANQSGRVIVQELFVGGPAQLEGLRPGDQILAVNGKSVENTQELIEVIASHPPSMRLDVLVRRGGWTNHFFVTLAGRADVMGLPKTRVAIANGPERRNSYLPRDAGRIDENTRRNIEDPYSRARNTAYGE